MISNTQITAQPEYDIQFWNAMRNKEAREDILAKGRDISTGTYSMPTVAAGKVMNEIEKESDFRKIATVIRAYKNGYKIFAKDCKDKAEFVAEGAAIPVYESAGDFDEKTIESYKLASIVTLDEDFVNHAHFVCAQCSAVYDLPDIEPPVELMRRVTCGCPSTCELTFTGVCNDCISPDAGSKITI